MPNALFTGSYETRTMVPQIIEQRPIDNPSQSVLLTYSFSENEQLGLAEVAAITGVRRISFDLQFMAVYDVMRHT
jgi:hypothetical protein